MPTVGLDIPTDRRPERAPAELALTIAHRRVVMHTDPVLVIINPLSGPGRRDAEGRARQRAGVARQALSDVGLEGRVEITAHANHGDENGARAVEVREREGRRAGREPARQGPQVTRR